MTNVETIRAFIRRKLRAANDAATLMQLHESAEQYQKNAESRLSLIADIPRFAALRDGYGVTAWAAVLFVDLRNSSFRAERFGPKVTYLTMHAYLHTMAFVVAEMGGYIVGFRGDGLFAAFGIDDTGQNPARLEHGEEVRRAVRCGKAMLEAAEDALVPELAEYEVPGDVRIGVGIDASNLVITRIGLANANEVTAYGTAVNKAAHGSDVGNREVMITPRAKKLYPWGPKGKMDFRVHPSTKDFLKVAFPPGFRVLPRLPATVNK